MYAIYFCSIADKFLKPQLKIKSGLPYIMTKLFVYGVNRETPNDLLEETFNKCGEVTDVFNTGKGFAFVTMSDQAGVDSAIDELHGSEIDGQEIKVEQAKAREEGGGGRGGRGRSFGSRGGRGGGGGACYNCNRTGHLARDCRDGDRRDGQRGGFGGRGGGRGRGRGCYNCNQDGHMARDCPEPDRRDR